MLAVMEKHWEQRHGDNKIEALSSHVKAGKGKKERGRIFGCKDRGISKSTNFSSEGLQDS